MSSSATTPDDEDNSMEDDSGEDNFKIDNVLMHTVEWFELMFYFL